ncbi:GAF domain-containing protein [Tenuifilum thalassicum]|uniref:GAF domain-containing protein n=1 Tax=Tenuifilum thalassicum TaxID=2590900 RepID=A0A7D4BQP1_9BACT|nr:GAF domain-containing protein [Tenuifilum thalassicum]QKG78961.1 GAF domain-containing protein [Tenuifilum thalassicum]
MSRMEKSSRAMPIVILLLSIVGSLLIFSLVYNYLTSSGVHFPAWLIALSLIPTLLVGWFYFYSLKLQNQVSKLNSEIDSLKTQVRSLVKSEDKEEDFVEKKTDYQVWVNKLLPEFDKSDIEKYSEALLANIAKSVDIVQGQFYLKDSETGVFRFISGYAFYSETPPPEYTEGETLAGQVAKNKKLINIDNIPDGYITILSGLGKGSPKHLIITPVLSPDNQTIGIIELASFKPFENDHEELFSLLGRKLGEEISISK